ncbi:YidB family protein [Zoogloea sp.]|uniref:YidB family protein n=1 Tax=Zoogloea sp. TaxID=49181 RepID=UPI0035B1CF60
MGLLDQLAGQVLGSLAGEGQPQQGGGGQAVLLQLVLGLLQSQGGLGGLLGKLSQAGLGEQVASWVGTGQNLPVSADQIGQALGGGALGDMAAQLGIPSEQLAGHIANFLPQVVDQMTPSGQMPEGGHLDLGDALTGLAAMLGK